LERDPGHRDRRSLVSTLFDRLYEMNLATHKPVKVYFELKGLLVVISSKVEDGLGIHVKVFRRSQSHSSWFEVSLMMMMILHSEDALTSTKRTVLLLY
jgi:hypothetical protein